MVHKEPYCLWGYDISERNVDFLNGFDTKYFEFVTDTALAADDEKRASVLLYTTLHHAIETLFSLIGAYVQAPDCVFAWMAKCQNSQLRDLIIGITDNDDSIFRKLKLQSLSWDCISKSVVSRLPYEDERKAIIANHFSTTWSRLAAEFTDEIQIDQYNSIKHGLRVRPGGFKLAIGEEVTPGAEPKKFHDLGGSDYGMTYQKIRNIWPDRKSRSIRYTKTSVNWSINKVIGQLRLANCSIVNLISILKCINGVPPNECKFMLPQQDEDFESPWNESVGVNNFTMDFTVDTTNTEPVTANKIIEILMKE